MSTSYERQNNIADSPRVKLETKTPWGVPRNEILVQLPPLEELPPLDLRTSGRRAVPREFFAPLVNWTQVTFTGHRGTFGCGYEQEHSWFKTGG